eukprot:TRINITY_DN64_c0_g4_i1.p1 TRINITY_DN64_c0_g4~~TRINITY_DN64_c0_g4_i1.p1  ORF type:complete len:231 (+),score=41.58 TRINITY_DN64_c0_g4_i1:85-693(+)
MLSHESEINRRATLCKPGALVYSAKMDQDALEKLYCCMFLCPVKQELASRSFIDVHTNGLHSNIPLGCCFCCWLDNGRFVLWDDKRMGDNFGRAGCCKPFPWCCPHACGCCGEGMYMNKTFGCCLKGLPTFMGHCSMVLFIYFCGLCMTDVFLGLSDGEATRLAEQIERARRGEGVPLSSQPPDAIVPPVAVMGDEQKPTYY